MLATALASSIMFAAESALAKVVELKDGDEYWTMMDEMNVDFGIFSLYKSSDSNSVVIDDLVTNAEAYFKN